jgi:hypothetical protein
MHPLGIALIALLLSPAPAQDEMEENAEYKAWAKHKPGAWVKWSVETQTGAMKMAYAVTWTLKELTPDKAVIEEKTVLGAAKGPEHTNSRTIPSKVRKGTTSEGARVELLKEGDEEVEVKGRPVKCRWVEMKLLGRTGGAVKVWKTDEVVGGAAKTLVKHDDAAKMTMTMTAVDWKTAD